MTNSRFVLNLLTGCLSLTVLWFVPAEARTWKSASGSYSVEAELVAVEDGVAVLKRDDNRQVIRVPLDKLSEADQLFAKKQMEEKAKSAASSDPMSKGDAEEKPKPKPDAKVGAYTFQVPEDEGIDMRFYQRSAVVYGAKLKQDLLQKMQQGEQLWLKLDEPITWEIVVPSSYAPAEPMGLFVFISASPEGAMPERWKPVLEKHRLIWVGLNKAGNKTETMIRHSLALEAAARMNRIYALDPDRIYVSGTSGGGRVSSQVMLADADIFTGGFPLIGCNPYRQMPAEKPGQFYPATFDKIHPQIFNLAKQRSRFVFLTGSKDFNRFGTIGVHKIYQQDGFKYLTYLEVPGMGHAAPDAEWFEKGIVALDAPLHAAAEENYKAAITAMNRKQLGEALEGFRRATLHGEEGDYLSDAKEKFQELNAQYRAQIEELETMIEEEDFSAATRGISALKRAWGQAVEKDAQRLIDTITAARKANR